MQEHMREMMTSKREFRKKKLAKRHAPIAGQVAPAVQRLYWRTKRNIYHQRWLKAERSYACQDIARLDSILTYLIMNGGSGTDEEVQAKFNYIQEELDMKMKALNYLV